MMAHEQHTWQLAKYDEGWTEEIGRIYGIFFTVNRVKNRPPTSIFVCECGAKKEVEHDK
jgi:hypothetical protein